MSGFAIELNGTAVAVSSDGDAQVTACLGWVKHSALVSLHGGVGQDAAYDSALVWVKNNLSEVSWGRWQLVDHTSVFISDGSRKHKVLVDALRVVFRFVGVVNFFHQRKSLGIQKRIVVVATLATKVVPVIAAGKNLLR